MSRTSRRPGRLAGTVLAAASLVVVAGCGDSASGTSGSDDESIGVTLITKTASNPFFLAMEKGAEQDAERLGVSLTTAAGKEDGDEPSQVAAIENAISRGDKGIIIAPNGPSVLDAIGKARDAGIYVIAVDTPPDPADAVDITFATDNRLAGQLIGQWAAAQLDGQTATIGMLDLFADKVVTVDNDRDQGFLEGMGIDVKVPDQIGDEDPTGTYTGGAGGDYVIVGNEPSQATEDGGRTAMENLLSKNPDINLVYTINEPAAYGAYQALQAAGKENDVLLVSVDGGCSGVDYVEQGIIGATSQQYPLDMAKLAVEAIAELAMTGEKPENTPGLSFYNTGVKLVTDKPADGVESIDTTEGTELCWG